MAAESPANSGSQADSSSHVDSSSGGHSGNMSHGVDVSVIGLNDLATQIQALPQKDGIVAVAIAGAPGSGKSSVAAALQTRIGATSRVVPMDGFHLDNETLEARGLLPVKGAPETFDMTGFGDLVDGLKARTVWQYPTFDRDSDSVVVAGGSIPDGVSILIFEGNYLLFDEQGWRALAAKWDASLWLDVPEDVLVQRLIQRWLDQGMAHKDAVARAQGNDIPNAQRVVKRALPATWRLQNV